MSSKLSIFQLNDLHGYLKPHLELFWKNGEETFKTAGGLARIHSFLEKKKEKNKNTLILDNGDTFHGTYVPIKNKGKEMASIMNEIGFDAMTLHWEFAYQLDGVKKIERRLNYPILAMNCYKESNGKRPFKKYDIIEKNDLKIGVIGVAATIVDKTMPEEFSEGIYFTLGNQELPVIVNEIKDKVDLVVVLSHLGFPQEVELAKEVNEIDVLLSGHTHDRLHKAIEVDDTIIFQSGCHGSFIGELEIFLRNGEIENYSHRLNVIDASIKENKKISHKIKEITSPYESYLNEVIGETKTNLHRYNVLESTMDNLLLKAIKEKRETDLAFSNGWRYGAPLAKGDEITIEDIWQIVPANPKISTCSLKGKEISEMLENNIEHTFSNNPFNQMGGYLKRCLGLNVYFKIENPRGNRIQEIYIGNKRLDLEKEYSATYLSIQAVPEKYGRNRKVHDMDSITALREFISKNSPVEVERRNTFVPI